MADPDGESPPDPGPREVGVPRSVKVLLIVAGVIVVGIVLLDAIALLGHVR